ncbi:hypothetical protein T492DRAFT_391302 [Pavlovales sp. CCMP2436]|nr:hypothetical protein T492DRAFT_391302 [Pavlovales sp. CCMP2436]
MSGAPLNSPPSLPHTEPPHWGEGCAPTPTLVPAPIGTQRKIFQTGFMRVHNIMICVSQASRESRRRTPRVSISPARVRGPASARPRQSAPPRECARLTHVPLARPALARVRDPASARPHQRAPPRKCARLMHLPLARPPPLPRLSLLRSASARD